MKEISVSRGRKGFFPRFSVGGAVKTEGLINQLRGRFSEIFRI